MYGAALMDGEPVFLKSGIHAICNASFQFHKLFQRTEGLIKFDNLHIIQVRPNQLGLAWEGNRPIIVGPGIWTKNSPIFSFECFRLANEPVIGLSSILFQPDLRD